MYAEVGTNMWKNFCPRWELNPQPHDWGGGRLSTSWATAADDYIGITEECYRNGAMRFTANKNVALSASTVTA